MAFHRRTCLGLLAAGVPALCAGRRSPLRAAAAGEPPDDAELARLHELVRPRPGESRWMEIDWYPSVWEGRQRAAAAGKPIFLWAGSGGAPAAGC